MQPVQKILWPSDASEPALRALESATVLARRFGAKLYGLQVVSQVPTFAETGIVDDPVIGFDVALYEEELRKAARKTLEETMQERVSDAVATETAVETGDPSKVIVRHASEHDIDLIVMATHGRSGISHVLLGSVAEATVRNSSVPVLVIPDTATRNHLSG